MEVYLLGEPYGTVPTVCALGLFDGVHQGHRALLEQTVALAMARGLTPAVLTFCDGGFKQGGRLTTQEERLALFEEIGIQRVYLMDFDTVRSLTPDAFVETLLIGQAGAEVAVCGFNYRYGRGAAGDADSLCQKMESLSRTAVVIPPASTEDGTPISSSRIRRAIEAGDIPQANGLLGRPYALVATVLHGQGLGHTLGLPTINQAFPRGQVVPSRGVYATLCYVDGVPYRGVTNVGVRPTVDGSTLLAESHLLGFTGDLYGALVRCAFYEKLREEQRFETLEALASQIRQDIDEVKRYDKY